MGDGPLILRANVRNGAKADVRLGFLQPPPFTEFHCIFAKNGVANETRGCSKTEKSREL
jgi:hypothetical protein